MRDLVRRGDHRLPLDPEARWRGLSKCMSPDAIRFLRFTEVAGEAQDEAARRCWFQFSMRVYYSPKR